MTKTETQGPERRIDPDSIRAEIKAAREQLRKDEDLLDFVRGNTGYKTRIFGRGDFLGFFRAVDEYSRKWKQETPTDFTLGTVFALYLGENRFFALTEAPLTEQTDGGFGANGFFRWIAGVRDYSGASFLFENLKIGKETK